MNDQRCLTLPGGPISWLLAAGERAGIQNSLVMRLPDRHAASSLSHLLFCAFSQGASLMAQYRRSNVSDVGEVAVVRFVDRKILDELNIQELGQELFQLVEEDNKLACC